MTLKEYLESKGLGDTEFGAQVGVTQPTVHRWKSGKLKPKPKKAREIERATNGAVPFGVWWPQ